MSKSINILITIDTDRVKQTGRSTDASHPIGIAHDMGYMVATGTTVNSGQGTGDLDFNALVGDTVRVFAVSGSDNFEDAVLVYGLPMFSGSQVLSPFQYVKYTKSTVVPGNPVLPAQIVNEDFWFYQANVVTTGVEGYMVQFALYTRNATTGQPELYSYYMWDPTIRVAG